VLLNWIPAFAGMTRHNPLSPERFVQVAAFATARMMGKI